MPESLIREEVCWDGGNLRLVIYRKDGLYHREDGPAKIWYDKYETQIELEEYYFEGKSHRDSDDPSEIWYYRNGNVRGEVWRKEGLRHRLDGPACVSYYESGGVRQEVYYYENKKHRED
jgi:antitoxin component YwqK of YwqJK toxin-antitoxin module